MKIKSLFLSLATLFLLTACNGPLDTEPMAFGDPNSDVLVEVFSDVQCPACAVVTPQVESIAREYENDLYYQYYHFPLSYHEYAFIGAMAVDCAREQGEGWEYLDKLYENQSSISRDYFTRLAEILGLNKDDFTLCLEEDRYRDQITAEIKEGRARGIPGTPSIFVNGEIIQWGGTEAFEKYLKNLING